MRFCPTRSSTRSGTCASAGPTGAVPGQSRFQTFWEHLTAALALETWGQKFCGQPLALLTDNVAALQLVLDLKGTGPSLAVSRELAWRVAARRWRLGVAHVPSEANQLADALCRLQQGAAVPSELAEAQRTEGADPQKYWVLSS